MKTSRKDSSLLAAVAPLARQIAVIQQQQRALGLFTNDRELLQCAGCGLKEDVTHDGRLLTYREPDLGQDTGLRFTPLAKHRFRCPGCGWHMPEPGDPDRIAETRER